MAIWPRTATAAATRGPRKMRRAASPYQVRGACRPLADEGCPLQGLEVIGQLLAAGDGLMARQHVHGLVAVSPSWHVAQRPGLLDPVARAPIEVIETHRLGLKQVATQQ